MRGNVEYKEEMKRETSVNWRGNEGRRKERQNDEGKYRINGGDGEREERELERKRGEMREGARKEK